MRILVDTTYLYELMASRDLFTVREREFLAQHNAQISVSAVSVWEMRLKYRVQKSPFDPTRVLEALRRQDVSLLPLTEVHAAQPLEVPLPHKDPFDDLLLVQAQVEHLRFLTKDRQLVNHPLAITIP